MSLPQFDPAVVRSLADILADTGLTEIEVVSGDARIRVVRKPAPVHVSSAVPAAAPASPAPAAPSAPAPALPAVLDDADHPGAITSPMVGVAYLSPEPGSQPYVAPGQAVSAGQTVLLIEAMKTFNQIKAPRAGTVMRVLVTSGQPVEYGEPLMVIE